MWPLLVKRFIIFVIGYIVVAFIYIKAINIVVPFLQPKIASLYPLYTQIHTQLRIANDPDFHYLPPDWTEEIYKNPSNADYEGLTEEV